MNPLMNSVGSNAEGKLNCINAVVITQKSFTVDFLTKKTKINEGEVPQYYVEDSHPAIIEPWEWEQVQVKLERRKNSRNRHHQASPFSGKIICADCGDIFGAKTWHSTDRYRRVIWQCNGKFKGEHKCETPHLTEDRMKKLYLAALGSISPIGMPPSTSSAMPSGCSRTRTSLMRIFRFWKKN